MRGICISGTHLCGLLVFQIWRWYYCSCDNFACKSASTSLCLFLERSWCLWHSDIRPQVEAHAERKKEGGRYKWGRQRKSDKKYSDVPAIYLSSGTVSVYLFLFLLLVLSFTFPCHCRLFFFLFFSCPLNHFTFSEVMRLWPFIWQRRFCVSLYLTAAAYIHTLLKLKLKIIMCCLQE